jgi:hypothetical protein
MLETFGDMFFSVAMPTAVSVQSVSSSVLRVAYRRLYMIYLVLFEQSFQIRQDCSSPFPYSSILQAPRCHTDVCCPGFSHDRAPCVPLRFLVCSSLMFLAGVCVFFFSFLLLMTHRREMKRQEVGENCIMRSFITCTLLQVQLE